MLEITTLHVITQISPGTALEMKNEELIFLCCFEFYAFALPFFEHAPTPPENSEDKSRAARTTWSDFFSAKTKSEAKRNKNAPKEN